MKKITLFVLLLCCGSIYSQKKKAAAAKAPASVVIVKAGNASAEIVKNNFYLFIANAGKKDTLLLKKYDAKAAPLECKINAFTAKGTPMYYVTWVENVTTETKDKKEESKITESQIWNPVGKVLLIGNTQTATKIRETVYLDKLKNASETQERMRNSGYIFTFLPEGDFTLRDKSSETKYVYNATTMKYDVFKPAVATPVASKKKKKK